MIVGSYLPPRLLRSLWRVGDGSGCKTNWAIIRHCHLSSPSGGGMGGSEEDCGLWCSTFNVGVLEGGSELAGTASVRGINQHKSEEQRQNLSGS